MQADSVSYNTEAEFDFQVGDIIAVTHTPPDGWWSGKSRFEAYTKVTSH